jgi:predicted amidohydrolase
MTTTLRPYFVSCFAVVTAAAFEGIPITATIGANRCISRSMTSSSSVSMSSSMSTAPPTPVGVAAIAQLRSTNNKLQNLKDVAKCCGMAQRAGASMIFLPECFAFIGTNAEETLMQAEPSEYVESGKEGNGLQSDLNSDSVNEVLIDAFQQGSGESNDNTTIESTADDNEFEVRSVTAALATLARTSGLWISAGGLHVKGDAPPDPATGRERVYNAHLILDSDGIVKARYDKRHLFDVSIPSQGVELRESKSTAPGTVTSVVCDSPVGRLGLSICYDVRFPEHYASLVQKHDAQILLVPSAFTVPTGAAHWHLLLQGKC